MIIQPNPPTPARPPQAPTPQPPTPPQDEVHLGGLARGAALGLGTFSPALIGGLTYGLPGALAGGAASFGLQCAVNRNPGQAARETLASTVLGVALALSKTAPTALSLGLAAGLGAVLGAVALHEPRAESADGPMVKINQPGAAVDVERHLVPGKTNIVCFSAQWCPACQRTEPKLEAFCKEHPEYVTLQVDIHDWDSPVSKQFGLKAIPCFMVYDGQGKQVAQGDAARDQVLGLLPH